MIAGVSTACFYPQHTEDALRELVSIGVRSAEIFLNCAGELEEPFLKELAAIAKDGGAKILSLHPYTSGMEPLFFFTQYDRRFAEGMELYKRYYRAANLLGAEIVVFHGALHNYGIENAAYFEKFDILRRDAAAFGVKLCQENVARCVSRSSAFLREMARELPETRFVLDSKQVVRSGEKIEAYTEALRDKIVHIHISDHNEASDCLLPGQGVFNIAKFLADMRNFGFDGGVIVELYRDNFNDIVEILQGYQQVLDSFPQ